MAKNCYCDWNLVWWWFWIFGSGSDYVLSKIFGSGSDSDTIEIFRSGSDYQISISAQHCWIVSLQPDTDIQKLLSNGNRIRIRISERQFSILWGSDCQKKLHTARSFIFLVSSEVALQLSVPWFQLCLFCDVISVGYRNVVPCSTEWTSSRCQHESVAGVAW